MGNWMESRVFLAAQFHGDSEMEMLESTISSLESISTVSVRAIGELKDKKLRSVADNGTMKRPEAQLSLRSLPPLLFHSVLASLVDGIIFLTCEDEWCASYLTRAAKVDYAQYVDAYDYGWVLNVSNSRLFVTMSLSSIMNWLISTPLNCEDCDGQRSTMNAALVGYSRWKLFRILGCCYVLMRGPLLFYGYVCLMSWAGYCSMFPFLLRVYKTLTLVAQLEWHLHCTTTAEILLVVLSRWPMWICRYGPVFPFCASMMIKEFQLIMISTKDWTVGHVLCYKPLTMMFWLFQCLKNCENGCKSMPDKAIQPSVAPFYGEQPWMYALKCSSPFSKWSMMICVDSETRLLLFLVLFSCSFKWLCLRWKLSANVIKKPIESFSGICHNNLYLVLLVSYKPNPSSILLNSSLLSPFVSVVDVVGWFAKWSSDFFIYTNTALIIPNWLRMNQDLDEGGLISTRIDVFMVLYVVPSIFNAGWVILWTNGCLVFCWLALSLEFHHHLLTFSVNVLTQGDIEGGRPTKIRQDYKKDDKKKRIGLCIVVFINDLHFCKLFDTITHYDYNVIYSVSESEPRAI